MTNPVQIFKQIIQGVEDRFNAEIENLKTGLASLTSQVDTNTQFILKLRSQPESKIKPEVEPKKEVAVKTPQTDGHTKPEKLFGMAAALKARGFKKLDSGEVREVESVIFCPYSGLPHVLKRTESGGFVEVHPVSGKEITPEWQESFRQKKLAALLAQIDDAKRSR